MECRFVVAGRWLRGSKWVCDLLLSVECQLGHSSLMPAPYFTFTLCALVTHLLGQSCHLGPLLFLYHPLPLAHSCGMLQPRLSTCSRLQQKSCRWRAVCSPLPCPWGAHSCVPDLSMLMARHVSGGNCLDVLSTAFPIAMSVYMSVLRAHEILQSDSIPGLQLGLRGVNHHWIKKQHHNWCHLDLICLQ